MKNKIQNSICRIVGLIGLAILLALFGNIQIGSFATAIDAYAAGNPFADVPTGAYFYPSVMWAYENNITTGTSANKFSPSGNCTRGQMVTFLWRAAGKPEPTITECPFADVDPAQFYYTAVLWAYENGITTGTTDTTFDPNGKVTRGQAVTFIWRLEGQPAAAGHGFKDVAAGKYYADAVNWAAGVGITTGTSATTFGPETPCKREHIVTFLYRWKNTLNVLEFGAVPNDNKDDTRAINDALYVAATGGRGSSVYVPAGKYIIDPLSGVNLQTNTSLVLDNAAVFEVSGTDLTSYSVIRIANVSNASVSGGKINGERSRHKGNSGEWGMGINIIDSKDITISNMTIADNWGDGIYLGTDSLDDKLLGCSGIKIQNCTIKNNRRSNISIVDADNVTISNCHIANANGTAPSCGVNIEPNRNNAGRIPDDSICRNITIADSTFDVVATGNIMGQYYCFMTAAYPDPSIVTCQNLKITNCKLNGDCGNFSGLGCTIQNSTITGIFYDERNTSIVNTSCGQLYHSAAYGSEGNLQNEWLYEFTLRDEWY